MNRADLINEFNDLGEQNVVTSVYNGFYGGENHYRFLQGSSNTVSEVSCGKEPYFLVKALAVDMMGGKLFLATMKSQYPRSECSVQIYDFHSSELMNSLDLGKLPHSGVCLQLSQDGHELIIGNVPNAVVWDVTEPLALRSVFQRSIDQWDCYCFNCNNEVLFLSVTNKILQVFDRITGALVRSFALPIGKVTTYYSPQDVMTPQLILLSTTLIPHPFVAETIALHASRDQVHIITGLDETAAPKQCLLVNGTGAVSFLHETFVCVVGKDHARIWNYSTQQRIHKFQLPLGSNVIFIAPLNSLYVVNLGEEAGCHTVEIVDLERFQLSLNLLTIRKTPGDYRSSICGVYHQSGAVLL